MLLEKIRMMVSKKDKISNAFIVFVLRIKNNKMNDC